MGSAGLPMWQAVPGDVVALRVGRARYALGLAYPGELAAVLIEPGGCELVPLCWACAAWSARA